MYFRRFSSSFHQLRLDHRKLKNARNPESLSQFERGLYAWPEKTENVEPVVLENVSDEEEGHEEGNVHDEPDQRLYPHRATTSGRFTGEIL